MQVQVRRIMPLIFYFFFLDATGAVFNHHILLLMPRGNVLSMEEVPKPASLMQGQTHTRARGRFEADVTPRTLPFCPPTNLLLFYAPDSCADPVPMTAQYKVRRGWGV